MGCPNEWVLTHLLVLSVKSQPVLQSFSEVVGDRRAWGQSGACSLQGLMDGVTNIFRN